VAAGPGELGNQLAELGMDRPAVIALVVVLEHDLPVRRDLVAQPGTGAQAVQLVGGNPGRNGAQCFLQRRRGGRLEPGEDEAAPGVDVYRVQRERGTGAAEVGQERGGPERSVEAGGPGVVRASDRAGETAAGTGVQGCGLAVFWRHQPRASVPAQIVEAS